MARSTTIQVSEKVSRELSKLASTKGEAVDRLLALAGGMNTRTLSFNEKIPAGKKATFVDESPMDGAIKMISIQWPSGTNFLVGVKVSHENISILPKDGFLYKDDYKQPYVLDERVSRKDRTFIEIANGDSVHAHQISLEVLIIGRK